jgi:hypothetical protein
MLHDLRPKGALHISPGQRPGKSDTNVQHALKGQSNLLFGAILHCPFGVIIVRVSQPRATLRFALGLYAMPLWGEKC